MQAIDEKVNSLPVKITDKNEGDCAKVNASEDLFTADIIEHAGVDGTLSGTAGTPFELKVGGSPLADRKVIFFIPNAKGKFGFTAGVGTQSIPVFKSQPVTIDAGPGVSVWFDFDAGGPHDLYLAEGS